MNTASSAHDERRVFLPDEAATERLGVWLGERLAPGQGLALCGELGAGKTCLVRGLARGLGLDDPDAICSPTYLLVMEHPGPRPLLHLDAYLPEKTRAFLMDGGLDYLEETAAVIAVEWADRVPDLLPAETLWLRLEPRDSGREAILVDRTNPMERRALATARPTAFPWLVDLPEQP